MNSQLPSNLPAPGFTPTTARGILLKPVLHQGTPQLTIHSGLLSGNPLSHHGQLAPAPQSPAHVCALSLSTTQLLAHLPILCQKLSLVWLLLIPNVDTYCVLTFVFD